MPPKSGSFVAPAANAGSAHPSNELPALFEINLTSVDVRFTPESDRLLRCREMTRWAMYGRRPRCKRNLTFCEAFGCSHVYGLFSPEGLPPSRSGRCGRWPWM